MSASPFCARRALRTGFRAVLGFCLAAAVLSPSDVTKEAWSAWLAEVRPIMTRAEAAVFRSLRTEEDRRRFQELFWKARDPKPQTPQNEFFEDYRGRLAYVRQRLKGPDSDRGRLYLVLGPPAERRNFGGYEDLIDCEVWSYRPSESTGLPPFLNILFFKPGNLGDYKLYTPGLHSPLDLLAYQGRAGGASKPQAYAVLRRRFPDLAEASLSVIPEAGGTSLFESPTSSGRVLAEVFALPDRQAAASYLKGFGAEGTVETRASTREILGWTSVAVTEMRGLKFLSYALMPDSLPTVLAPGQGHGARLATLLRVEDEHGRTVLQQEREFDFRLDTVTMARAERAKIVFEDFAPIIPGEFNVILSFRNAATDEFFTAQHALRVTAEDPCLLVGHDVRPVPPGSFGPFRLGPLEARGDPRGLFSPADVLTGVVKGPGRPDIQVVSAEDPGRPILVQEIAPREDLFLFRLPLEGLKSGAYRLRVSRGGSEIALRDFRVLSFALEKPLEAKKTEESEAYWSYVFGLGSQYVQRGEPEPAASLFRSIPSDRMTPAMRPSVAAAHYGLKDFERVVALLAGGAAEDYPVLWLLGNSLLELKRFREAAAAFEKLRAYGDTPEKNRTLGALYLSMGEREKAKEYWERADRLEKVRAGKRPPDLP